MKKITALMLALLLLSGMCMPMASAAAEKDGVLLRIIVPENWEMEKGDSRTLDVIMSGTEKRVLVWSAEPSDVASVDIWGRVTALKTGTATITAQNADGLTDSVELKVVKKSTKIADNGIKKVDFTGEAIAEGSNLQKVVTRFEKGDKKVPKDVAD